MERLIVAGIPVDPIDEKTAAARLVELMRDGRQHLIATPNPEMAILASRDPSFRGVLESASLALADGFGLRVAAWVEGKRIPATVTGADFVWKIANLAEQNRYSVFLLGAGEGIAADAASALRAKHPGLRVVGAESGGRIRWIAGRWEQDPGLLGRITSAAPDVLLVGLGHGKQERWIRDQLPKLPSVKVAMGLGGTFDYLSGAVRRAPAFLRKIHFEWLWRLFQEPKRIPRIFEATVVFMWQVLKSRLKKR